MKWNTVSHWPTRDITWGWSRLSDSDVCQPMERESIRAAKRNITAPTQTSIPTGARGQNGAGTYRRRPLPDNQTDVVPWELAGAKGGSLFSGCFWKNGCETWLCHPYPSRRGQSGCAGQSGGSRLLCLWDSAELHARSPPWLAGVCFLARYVVAWGAARRAAMSRAKLMLNMRLFGRDAKKKNNTPCLISQSLSAASIRSNDNRGSWLEPMIAGIQNVLLPSHH